MSERAPPDCSKRFGLLSLFDRSARIAARSGHTQCGANVISRTTSPTNLVGGHQYGSHVRRGDDQLIERNITFAYDFRMRCEGCGQASPLSGAEYRRLDAENDAMMDCEHCDGSIHFGPRAAAIRDVEDPALDDTRVNELSWYHSSTYGDWPSSYYERNLRAEFTSARMVRLMGDPQRYIAGQLDKALHVGTYEAAIENMYRRMRNQADQDSQFFLHRVRVNIPAGRVNAGHRDENNEPAAEISLTELHDLGLDAIRYLNAWEAPGCVSLAVHPKVLREVQTIKVPTDLAPVRTPEAFAGLVADLLERDAALTASAEERTLRGYSLMGELETALVAQVLPSVNLEVAEEFTRAVRAIGRYSEAGGSFAKVVADFCRHAPLLLDPASVLRLLDDAPSRAVCLSGTG